MTGSSYRACSFDSWVAFEPRWRALESVGHTSPFQRTEWLRHWYESFLRRGSVAPLLVAVTDLQSGNDVMLLPLIVRSRGLLSIVEFADLGVTDYNAPLLGPSAPRDTEGAQSLWRALVDGLDGYDAIRLQKMPRQIGECFNPLALGQHTRVADLRRWGTVVDSQWAAKRRSSRAFKRSQNGLTKAGSCRFLFAKTEGDARRILHTLDQLQTERLRELGRSHILSQPLHRKFYHALGMSLQPDFSFLSALELDGEIIACLMSVAAKPSVTFLRIAADPRYAHLSVGRYLMDLTMIALVQEGYEYLDLSIGEAGHKERMGATPQSVYETVYPLSWQGSAYLGVLETRRLFGRMTQGRMPPQTASHEHNSSA